MAQLREFCLVSCDLVLISNLYICRLKGPMRREVCASRFLRISLFLPMGCYSIARHNSVSSASFFMVLCLFLIYVSVVWRARRDERSAIHRSSAFHIFVMGVLKHSYGTTWWALLCYSWSCAYFWPIYLLFEGPNEMRTYPFLASSQAWFSTNFRSLCLLITCEITSNCRLDYQCLHWCFFKTHS